MGDRRSGGRRWLSPTMSLAMAGLIAGGTYWYLQADRTVPGDAADLEQVAFGSRIYGRICANCHGSELDGQLGWEQPLKDGTRLAPAHSTDGETWQYSDEKLFEVVKDGGETLKPDGGVSRMPGFGSKLTEDEIWAVIAFIKSTWPSNVQDAQQNISLERSEATPNASQ